MKRPYREQTRPTSWRRLAIATWRPPDDPTVYGTIEVDMTDALGLIEQERQAGQHVTVTHLVTKALALAIAAHPEGNGLIIGKKVFLRDQVDIFCQVASEDGRDLSGVKIRDAPHLGVADIARQLAARAERVRAGKDQEVEQSKAAMDRIPGRLLGPAMKVAGFLTYGLGLDLRRLGVAWDQFGSAMVTSIGSIDAGLGMALAPMVPFSRVPIIVLVNAVQKRPTVVDDEVVVRPMMTLGCTFDHRFIDGVIASKIARDLHQNMTEATARLGPPTRAQAASAG